MKDFKIKVKATSEKEIIVCANSAEEAANFGVQICSEPECLNFNENDIICIEGEVVEEKTTLDDDFDCSDIECEECQFLCDECGSCLLVDNDNDECKDCHECEFYCNECGACTIDTADDEDYVDEEFELRKAAFKDFLEDVYEEIVEYANSLFGED